MVAPYFSSCSLPTNYQGRRPFAPLLCNLCHTTRLFFFWLPRTLLQAFSHLPTTSLSIHSRPTIQFVRPSAPLTQGTSQSPKASSPICVRPANLLPLLPTSISTAFHPRSARLKHSSTTFPSRNGFSLSSYQISTTSQLPGIVPAVYHIASCHQRHSAITGTFFLPICYHHLPRLSQSLNPRFPANSLQQRSSLLSICNTPKVQASNPAPAPRSIAQQDDGTSS